jgi:hypothetical protein
MAHTHANEPGYYLDQLCTIGVSAGLGGVCLVLWWTSALGLLADPFHVAVLLGGCALLIVALVRGVTLWSSFTPGNSAEHEHGHHHHEDHEHEHQQHHHEDHKHHHHLHHEDGHGHAHHHHHHDHDHAHAHAAHDHDHGHGHGWNPIRYVFLLLPIVLFMVRMPSGLFNERFHKYAAQLEAGQVGKENYELLLVGKTVDTLGLQINKKTAEEPLQVVRAVTGGPAEKAGIKANDVIATITLLTDDDGKPLPQPQVLPARELTLDEAAAKLRGKAGTKVMLAVQHEGAEQVVPLELERAVVIQTLGFKELERASVSPITRQAYEGMTVRLRGQFVPRDAKTFSLLRLKITCCGADMTRLRVLIVIDPQSKETTAGIQAMDWVEVTGQVTFNKLRDRDEYVPVLQVASRAEGIRPTDAEAFLQ